MAKILDFNSAKAQYDGDLFTNADGTTRTTWWTASAIWQQRELVESITRPTENAALLNLFLQARALEHWRDYACALDDWQARALELELKCKRERPHLRGQDVYVWIASQMPGFGGEFGARRVKALLDEATELLRHEEYTRIVELMDARERERDQRVIQTQREVLHELRAEVWARNAEQKRAA